jgi:predicted RNA-binding Zn-ribbon protein involved in translation (DUF1610 family)
MFIHFDEDKCPSCGTYGRKVHEEPAAFLCPSCTTSFGKFGIIFAAHAHDHSERECN